MDNKNGKLFVVKHSKGRKFMPRKVDQNTFGRRICLDWGSLCACPCLLAATGDLLRKGGILLIMGEGKGPISTGDGRREGT